MGEVTVRGCGMKKKTKERLVKTFSMVILLAGSALMLLPFFWMVSTSFKDLSDVFVYPPKFFGSFIKWSNYVDVLQRFDFLPMFSNTLLVTIGVLVTELITSTMAGYAFACLKFRGKNILFLFYLISMMIPFHVMLVPTFELLKNMNLLNSLWSLIWPVLTLPFGVFLMRQFFGDLPIELAESAKIDGCTPWGIFTKIYLPLSKPSVATLSIFIFIATWNDFLKPLIYLSDSKKNTLTLGIYLMQGTNSTNWPVLMATCTLSLLPALILFLCMQDLFVEGIAMSGIKG